MPKVTLSEEEIEMIHGIGELFGQESLEETLMVAFEADSATTTSAVTFGSPGDIEAYKT